MGKILIIDGGKKGERIKTLLYEIRKKISPSELIIKYSTSKLDGDGNFHDLKDFPLAIIHDGDNSDKYRKPIYNFIARNSNTKLVLFSGGFTGFNIESADICKINDKLLIDRVSDFLRCLIDVDFKTVDFRWLFPGKYYFFLEELFILREKISILIHTFNSDKTNADTLTKLFSEFENILKTANIENKYTLHKNKIFNFSTNDYDYFEILKIINSIILKIEELYEPA